MSTPAYVTVSGVAVQRLTIFVPRIGPWFCDANLVDNLPAGSGRVTIKIGDTFTAVGTVDAARLGSFALNQRARIVAGAGAWSSELPGSAYRNDAGVTAQQVAQDAAAAAGETLAAFAGAQPSLGAHYIRDAGPASKTLEDAARGVPWWVDFAGATHVAQRSTAPVDPKGVTLLDYDPRLRRAVLAVDDLTAIAVGSVITDDRIDAPVTVASFEIHVEPGEIRVVAWCGDTVQAALADALRSIIARFSDDRLFGKYRYRVVTIDPGSAGRLNLQAVAPSTGVPDMLSISAAVAGGVHTRPALGSTVFVEFVAGDRGDPIVTGYEGRGGPGFVPQGVTLGAADDAAPLAARQGDMITMLLPPFVFTGTIGGSPATGVLVASTGQSLGTISGGSAKNVRIG